MKGVDYMSTKPINFRVDEELKSNAEVLLKEMGLTMSSALVLSCACKSISSNEEDECL